MSSDKPCPALDVPANSVGRGTSTDETQPDTATAAVCPTRDAAEINSPSANDGMTAEALGVATTAATEGTDQTLPVERQVLPFDPTENPDMDPLEYSVRSVVPMPREYYWNTGNFDIPVRTKVWHRTIAALGSIVRFFERTGEGVANVTGLNTSRFDYVTENMTEEQWERSKKNAERMRMKSEARLKAMEERKVEDEVGGDLGVRGDAL